MVVTTSCGRRIWLNWVFQQDIDESHSSTCYFYILLLPSHVKKASFTRWTIIEKFSLCISIKSAMRFGHVNILCGMHRSCHSWHNAKNCYWKTMCPWEPHGCLSGTTHLALSSLPNFFSERKILAISTLCSPLSPKRRDQVAGCLIMFYTREDLNIIMPLLLTAENFQTFSDWDHRLLCHYFVFSTVRLNWRNRCNLMNIWNRPGWTWILAKYSSYSAPEILTNPS